MVFVHENETNYFEPPTQDAIPRPIVIDGCNIGRSASGFSRSHVDCAGLVSVVRWFLLRNFDVTVFLPVVYNNINNYNARNAELLHKLEQLGIVTFTPARSGRGLRKAFINYDDLYVVSYAARHGGCILSGDKFKDILNQTCYSDFHNVIRHRTLDINFRPLALDFVKYGNDLLYKHAPEILIYENVNLKNEVIRRKLFVMKHDDDYQLVSAHRHLLSQERRALLCMELDELLISMSLATGKEFEQVDQLPYLDTIPNAQLLRMEDVFSSQICAQFYSTYSKKEAECDPLSPFVMEPVGDMTIRRSHNIISDEILMSQESLLSENSEGEKELLNDERLIDLRSLIGDNMLMEEHEDGTNNHVEESKIHPDLADIDIKTRRLPHDLSSRALLEWYIDAEKD